MVLLAKNRVFLNGKIGGVIWCYMVLYGVILGKHNEGELGIEQ